jgi:UPF0755 protein
MKKKPSSCLVWMLALTLIGLCLVAGLAVAAVFGLPALAAQTFGPPAHQMGIVQRTLISARLLLTEGSLTRPLDPAAAPQPFAVESGESPRQVALRLQKQGLIADADAFVDYLVYSGLDTGLQAREYRLSAAAAPLEIALQMQDATPNEVKFTILPGWRSEEIEAALPTSGLAFTAEDLRAAVAAHPQAVSFAALLPAQAGADGFLLPGTYILARDLSADGFVATALDHFDRLVGKDLRLEAEQRGLNLYQWVTLASIIQREAMVEAEMPLIASVFHNRLKRGMKLDSDPTVQYALGWNAAKKTWWTNPLSSADLQVNSPYNTYKNSGLPPGPIANPSLAALQAAASPDATPFLYFRAACDGSGRHVFAKTFDEHLVNACP